MDNLDRIINDWFALRVSSTVKGDLPGHEFRGNQYTDGGGGSDGGSGSGGGEDSRLSGGGESSSGTVKVISNPRDIAEKLADRYEKEYGFDATHTREGFIKNQTKRLEENKASPEFSKSATRSIDAAVTHGEGGSDVTYIVMKSGESGYEGGQYDPALKTITVYESNSSGHAVESLGDAANISNTYSDPVRGTVAHEYGHHYAQKVNPKAEQQARVKLENATPEEKRFIKKSISYYASTSPQELAAEAYAMKKHPDFNKQPKEVIDFVESIIND